MPGIALDTVAVFQQRVATFSPSYIADWDVWLATAAQARPARLGKILRKWQACRPNTMRRDSAAEMHEAPYLDDLLALAAPHVAVLSTFDLADPSVLENPSTITALGSLWSVFEQLSYQGRARGGIAGSVGISKAVMLVTDGRVGPAFDNEVRTALGLGKIGNPSEWHSALRIASHDIQAFHRATGVAFAAAKPRGFETLENGRVYDMALGPR
ncbi:hypothetical protein [Burkholderia sp. BE17]|uniref:hypothetical protein n=1 Tax=Burkholderia sp. BE17 TaxID=2656644 RepID=UPI00128D04EA|nr:hypothetical protein [Burkholderia sp. BE17]MPV64374.1 hypothetical protein [Burkholderia sp. BE17]